MLPPAKALPITPASDEDAIGDDNINVDEILQGHRLGSLVEESTGKDAEQAHVRTATRRDKRSHMEETFEAHQQAAVCRRVIQLAQGDNVTTIMDRLHRWRTGHPHTKSVGSYSVGSLSAAVATDETTSSGVAQSTASSSSGRAAPCKEAPRVPSGGFEGYSYEVDESCVHFDMQVEAHVSRHELYLLLETLCFAIIIGALLGIVAATITFFEGLLIRGRNNMVEASFEQQANGQAYAAYALTNTAFVLVAALLTYWAPMAITSGLPPLKAHLNGVAIPGLLTFRTLLAKTVGVTFVVATGLPLGREGPMVHTGAIVAARVTRFKMTWPFSMSTPIEVRVPSAQRSWVGIGCAAGVAAAFSAPLGGILYSFEEVCSHWSERMTWKSFVCVVVAAIVYNVLIRAMFNLGDGIQLTQVSHATAHWAAHVFACTTARLTMLNSPPSTEPASTARIARSLLPGYRARHQHRRVHVS